MSEGAKGPTGKRRKRPVGQTIGGVLFGFEQQVLRTTPPPYELVHHARPDNPVPAADGSSVTIHLPVLVDDAGRGADPSTTAERNASIGPLRIEVPAANVPGAAHRGGPAGGTPMSQSDHEHVHEGSFAEGERALPHSAADDIQGSYAEGLEGSHAEHLRVGRFDDTSCAECQEIERAHAEHVRQGTFADSACPKCQAMGAGAAG